MDMVLPGGPVTDVERLPREEEIRVKERLGAVVPTDRILGID